MSKRTNGAVFVHRWAMSLRIRDLRLPQHAHLRSGDKDTNVTPQLEILIAVTRTDAKLISQVHLRRYLEIGQLLPMYCIILCRMLAVRPCWTVSTSSICNVKQPAATALPTIM